MQTPNSTNDFEKQKVDETNELKKHFDQAAANWDDGSARNSMTQNIYKKIKKGLKKEFRIADYGCGTGSLISLLHEDVASVDGYDFSQGMLHELDKKILEQNLSNVQTFLIDAQAQDLPQKDYYDLVISSMTMHHVPDVFSMLQKLFATIQSGGKLIIIDLYSEDGNFHSQSMSGVYHKGFSKEQILDWFQKLGLQKIDISTVHVSQKPNGNYPIFLCQGTK